MEYRGRGDSQWQVSGDSKLRNYLVNLSHHVKLIVRHWLSRPPEVAKVPRQWRSDYASVRVLYLHMYIHTPYGAQAAMIRYSVACGCMIRQLQVFANISQLINPDD